jgi:hypothetical protein
MSMALALNSDSSTISISLQAKHHLYVLRAKFSEMVIQFQRTLLSNKHTVIVALMSLCPIMMSIESGTISMTISTFLDQFGLHRHLFQLFTNLGNGRSFLSVDDLFIQYMQNTMR